MFGPHACRLVIAPGVFALVVFAPWWAPLAYAVVTLAVVRRFEPGLRAAQARGEARYAAVEDALTNARADHLVALRAAIAAHRAAP